MKLFTRLDFIFIALLFIGTHALSQQSLISNFDVSDGLPSSEVYDVIQDSKGNLWFSTDAGISRFNGKFFKNFSSIDGLADETVFRCYEDPFGRIWQITFSGRLSFIENNQIKVYEHNDELIAFSKKNFGKHLVSHDIQISSDSTIFLSFKNPAVVVRIDRNGKTSLISASTGTNELLTTSDKCFVVEPLKRNGATCIEIISDQNNQEICHQNISESTSKHNIPAESSLLVLSKKSGVFVIKNSKFLKYIEPETNSITATTVISDEEFWVSTINSGITKYFIEGDSIIESGVFLKNETVSSFVQDHEGGYWFTTLNNGIFYVQNIDLKLITSNLESNKILKITGNKKDEIYLLYENTDIGIIRNNKSIQRIKNEGSEFKTIALTFDESKQTLFSGTSNSDKERSELNPKISHLYHRQLLRIDSTKYLNISARRIEIFNEHLERTKELRFNQRFDDATQHQDQIYISSMEGLFKLQADTISKVYPLKSKLRIKDIETFEKNLVLATSEQGVVIYNTDSSKVSNLTNESSECITIDDNNILWIGNKSGLTKIDLKNTDKKSELVFSPLSKDISTEINCLYNQNGYTYVGTSTGLIIIDSNSVFTSRTFFNPKSIQITSPFHFSDSTYQIEYPNQNLSVQLNAVSFRTPQFNYHYRLEGLSEKWISIKGDSLHFSRLSPGKYQLEITADNTPQVLTFKIEVMPAFWQTWWFTTSCILTGLIVLYLIFKWRIKVIRTRILNESIAKQELFISQHKALASQLNPHFLYNALNAISSLVYNKKLDDAMLYISKFSHLMRSTLNKSDFVNIPLKDEISTLENYVAIEQMRLNHAFEFVLSIDPEIDQSAVRIPSMLCQPFIENAIWHGELHKVENGKIELRFEKRSNGIFCIVKDNGIGREAAKIKNKKKSSGKGMNIAKQRIQLINRSNTQSIDLKIIDLKNADHKACGTYIEFKIDEY